MEIGDNLKEKKRGKVARINFPSLKLQIKFLVRQQKARALSDAWQTGIDSFSWQSFSTAFTCMLTQFIDFHFIDNILLYTSVKNFASNPSNLECQKCLNFQTFFNNPINFEC